MQLSSISVLEMSPEDRKWYKENRLYPQKTDEYWSCGSKKGYLKKGTSLSTVAEIGRQTLNMYKVSYKTVGKELQMHIKSPHLFKNNFVQTKNENCVGMQVCPFSAKNARPGMYVYDACHFSSQEITIKNIRLNRSITIEGKDAHMIEKHHFFPDYLSSKDVIEVLEIMPDPSFREKKSVKWEDSLESESSVELKPSSLTKKQVHHKKRVKSPDHASKHSSKTKVDESQDPLEAENTDDCKCIIS